MDQKRLPMAVLLVMMTLYPAWAQERQKPAKKPAAESSDILAPLLSELRRNPGDQALRERIIKLVLTLKSGPAVPEQAVEAEGAAEFAFKNAKSPSDYADAARQYEKALLAAPWLAADYFNQGVAEEKAGQPAKASRSFELYLLAAPGAADALDVRKRIGGLKYAAGKADQENSIQALAAKREADFLKQMQDEAEFLKKLDGSVWTYDQGSDPMWREYEIHGGEVHAINNLRRAYGASPAARRTYYKVPFQGRSAVYAGDDFRTTITISDDGRTLTAVTVDLAHGQPSSRHACHRIN